MHLTLLLVILSLGKTWVKNPIEIGLWEHPLRTIRDFFCVNFDEFSVLRESLESFRPILIFGLAHARKIFVMEICGRIF